MKRKDFSKEMLGEEARSEFKQALGAVGSFLNVEELGALSRAQGSSSEKGKGEKIAGPLLH